MPLRDHFHAPLKTERHWGSFHAMWITTIAERLNERLPERYFAEAQVHAGASIEIDVGTFRDEDHDAAPRNGQPSVTANDGGGTALAVMPEVFTSTEPDLSVGTELADDREIRVFNDVGGSRLVAAIELISPANKDRPESRQAFATKCASYLHNSIAVVIIDIVTERHANLHDEIGPLITSDKLPPVGEQSLYACAYRPIIRQEKSQIDMWTRRLALGEVLPTLPLWLNAVKAVPVELEMTYETALKRSRIA